MEIGKMEALGEEAGWKRKDEGGQAMESLGTGAREERLEAREERLEAKERVENRKEKRSFFIKSCTKRAKSRFFVTNNVKNVTF
ncbi:hypothetical protein [Segatella copri]|uniref:hypothetical protein n=1 Tax=Segatella copri TaxID=165179 RepID=UPI001C38C990|nr:hypothetical protein [Segatella copri]MBV4177380.1 hypothetical protein [Segatella copri]